MAFTRWIISLLVVFFFYSDVLVLAQNGTWETNVSEIPAGKTIGFGSAVVGDRIYLVGGFRQTGSHSNAGYSTSDILYFDTRTGTWTKEAQGTPAPLIYPAVEAVGTRIHVIGGGIDPNQIGLRRSHSVFDTSSGVWDYTCKALPNSCLGAGSCVIDGMIFTIGGLIPSNEILNGCEVFDPVKNQWEKIPDMQFKRAHHGVEVVDGIMYAIGGTFGEGITPLNQIEALDPSNSSWRMKYSEMPYPASEFGSCVFNGMIYVFGGRGGFRGDHFTAEQYSHVLMYDPLEDEWIKVGEMPSGRSGCVAHTIDDRIFVLGGYDASLDSRDNIHSWFPGIDVYKPVIDPVYAVERESFPLLDDNGQIKYLFTARFVNHSGMDFSPAVKLVRPSGREAGSFPLFDDGNHHDGDPGDGIYANLTSNIEGVEPYKVVFEAKNEKSGNKFLTFDKAPEIRRVVPLKISRLIIRAAPDNDNGSFFRLYADIINEDQDQTANDVRAFVFCPDERFRIDKLELQFDELEPGTVSMSKDFISLELMDFSLKPDSVPFRVSIIHRDFIVYNDIIKIAL